jgi:hypothetical protein
MKNLRENECNLKVYVFEYNNFKRVIAVLATMCLFIAGLLLIIEIPNIFTVLIGVIIIFWSFLKSLDILLLKELVINSRGITKRWYFLGEINMSLSSVTARPIKIVGIGMIRFFDQKKSYFENLFMTFMTFPSDIGGRNVCFTIKEILKNQHLIKGDAYDWVD